MFSNIMSRILLLGLLVTACGCGMGPQQRALKKLVETFVEAVDRGDEELAYQCILSQAEFFILNPDLGTEAKTASEETLGSLVSHFNRMVNYFEGRDITVKKFYLGQFWDKYPGHAGIRNCRVVIDANGMEYEILITGVVRIADRWRIVDLSGNSFY